MLGLLVLATAVLALPAGAVGKVGPKQFFTGVINGQDGNTTIPIVIQMACIGPVTPGETGHPLRGQTFAVRELFPPTTAGSLGYTGNDSEIGVFFNAPPPAADPIATPDFTRYDKTRQAPHVARPALQRTGTAYFTPVPVVPPSRSATVPVEFAARP